MKADSRVAVRLALALVVAGVGSGAFSVETRTQTSMPQPRGIPARTLPVPTTVSPAMQTLIGAPLSSTWNVVPQSVEWKPLAARRRARRSRAISSRSAPRR
jgi:hypothetical protein